MPNLMTRWVSYQKRNEAEIFNFVFNGCKDYVRVFTTFVKTCEVIYILIYNWGLSDVLIINFERIHHVRLVFPLLALDM